METIDNENLVVGVILNYNTTADTKKCINFLLQQKYENFMIIVVDNFSSNRTQVENLKKFCDEQQIIFLPSDKNGGFSYGNNIGIKKAIKDGCNYILTLNNDVEVPKESLKKAMEAIEINKEFDVFQLFMINYFNKDICDAAGLNFKDDLIPLQVGFKENVADILNRDDIKIDGVCAGAAIYSTKSLETVKLDDENYFDSNFFAYFEDVDLSLRLKGAGYKFKLLKDSIVYHMHSATGGKTSGFKEYYLTRNLFMYTKRNQTIEEYKKHKKEYYIRFLKTIVKNINNFNAIKLAVKGLSDGLKESKKIQYWKIQ